MRSSILWKGPRTLKHYCVDITDETEIRHFSFTHPELPRLYVEAVWPDRADSAVYWEIDDPNHHLMNDPH